MSRWSYRPRVQFAVLGTMVVTGLEGPIAITGAKERIVLARLVASAGRVVSTAELVDTVWGEEPPRSAVKSLQTLVLHLRDALEPARGTTPLLLVTDGAGYRLAIEPEAVDADQFARLVVRGAQALADDRPAAAATAFGEALQLWRGRAYAEFDALAFASAEARRLDELRLCALEGDLEARLLLGRPPAVVAADVERLVAEHPLREQLWRLLILALYRDGRQAEALAAYERARRLLVDTLGLDPGPELRAVHARVLAQDPGLRGDPPLAVPAQLRPPPGPFVGREAQLAALRDAWRRAERRLVTVAVRAPRGGGASRLSAELARDVARERAPVVLVEQAPAPVPAGPGLVVLDRPPGPVRPAVGGTGLVIALVGPATPVEPGVELVDLPPLRRPEVRELVATYVEEDDLDAATSEVLVESAGWPGAAHDAAAAWARGVAATRVEVAASSALRSSVELDAARTALTHRVAQLRELDARTVAADAPACPWRGLSSYEVEDGPWFAGRERLVAELVARLAASPLVAVVGDSGSGKSSLIRAGLLAALTGDALPGSGAWRRLVLRPGEHPMRELALTALGAAPTAADVGAVLERMLRGDGNGAERSVLVVDQLEEVWTACADAGEREAFLAALAELAADRRSHVRLVLGLRADFVGRLTGQPALAAAVSDATVLVSRPTEAELRRAVELPAARAALDLDVGLVDALVGDAGDEPGVLPLLSTALTGLWEHRQGQRLTLAAYVARGGLSGAVAHLADEAVAGLDEDERRAARVLLLRLSGPGEADRVTRRRVPLAALAELPDPRVRRVADALAAARLLTVSDGTVEVAHEALFREWPLLRGWLEEDLAGRAVLHRVTRAATEWHAEGRDPSLLWAGTRLAAGVDAAASHPEEITPLERAFLDAGAERVDLERRAVQERAETVTRQNSRLRRLLGALAVVLVLALVAGSLAVRSREQAVQATAAAEARRLAAAAVTEDYLDLAVLQAVEAVRSDPGPETHGALLALLARVPDVVTQVRTRNRYLGLAADAVAGAVYLKENEPRVIAVDADSGATRWTAELHSQVDALAPHPRAGLLATFSPDGRLELAALDPGSGRERWRLPVGSGRPPGIAGGFGPEAPVAVLPDGRVAVASRDDLVLVDTAAPRVVARLPWGNPVEPAALTLLPGGRLLVNRFDGPTLLLRLATGTVEEAPLRGWASSVSPDGTRLATAYDEGDHGVLQLLDTERFEAVAAPAPLPTWFDGGAWAADGETFVVATDRVLQVRDGRTAALRRELLGHSGSVFGLAFVGDGTDRLWSAGRDGAAFLWDVTGQEGVTRTAAAEVGTYLGDVAVDGRTAVAVAYGGGDQANTAHLVDAATGERLRRDPLPMPDGCACRPWAVAMVPDGRTAVAGLEHFPGALPEAADRAYDDRGSLVLWDVPDGRVRTAVPLPWPVWGVAVTPDGRRAVVNGTAGWAVVDLERGRLAAPAAAAPPLEPLEIARSAAVSPDGRLAALGRADGRLVLVDVRSGRAVRETTLPDDDRAVSVAWTGVGDVVLVGTHAGNLRFHRASDLQPAAPARLVTDGWVIDVRVSPTEGLAASVGTDGELLLWDTATWRPLGKRLTDGLDWGWVSFAPDGSTVRTHHSGGQLVQWSTDPDAWLDAACRVANRDLSRDEWALVHGDRQWRPTCSARA